MSNISIENQKYEYASEKPGIVLIKAGTPAMKKLNSLLGLPDLKSQIIDVPITSRLDELQVGRYAMQPSEDFLFQYTYLEVKVVTSGCIIVRDEQGNRYEAYPGDIYVFTPVTNVIFDKESNGTAVYFGHRPPEPAFMK